MCSGVTSARFKPGKIMSVMTRSGQYNLRWGFANGIQYNVRADKLISTWKHFNANRGILTVESFWEGGTEFVRNDNGLFNVGVLYSALGEFAIITVDSNEIVKPHHHRMPMMIQDNNVSDFMNVKLNYDELSSGVFMPRGGLKTAA